MFWRRFLNSNTFLMPSVLVASSNSLFVAYKAAWHRKDWESEVHHVRCTRFSHAGKAGGASKFLFTSKSSCAELRSLAHVNKFQYILTS